MINKLIIYTLEDDFHYKSSSSFERDFVFSIDTKIWLILSWNGNIEIRKGYSWDGCSPKFEMFGKVWGTPDGSINKDTSLPKTYRASLVHDALLQFSQSEVMPFTRKEIDKLFYFILKQDKFKFAYLYYIFVRLYAAIKGK